MQTTAVHAELGAPVLPRSGVFDGSAEGLGHGLESVADAEHGDAEVEERGIELGRTLGVDAGGSAGKHKRDRVLRRDLLGGRGMRDHLGVHIGLAHTAGDQLRVLGAEIDDENRACVCGIVCRGVGHRVSLVGQV